MKFYIPFFILTAFCFAGQDSAIVRFANGEQLSGNAVALNLQTLTWQSELLKEQANFKLDKIQNLELPSKLDTASIQNASHEAVLQLTNGDTVKGLLTGLNEKEIHLKTWYAGNMVFKRLNVKSITITQSSRIIYSGPVGMDDWKLIGNNSWQYSNNEFASKTDGGIARDIDFSDQVQISYDLAWSGMLKSKIVFFTSDITTNQPQSGYELSLQGSLNGMRRLSDNTRLRVSTNPRREQVNEKTRVSIRISRETNKIMLFMDDVLQASWQDDEMADNKGKGLIFCSDDSHDIKISNIVVAEWDGQVDETVTEDVELMQQGRFRIEVQGLGMKEQPEKPKELPEGRMMLANGDSLEGEVLGIEAEMIKIKTPFTEVKFPVNRIRNIAMKKDGLEEAIRKNGDVRGLLADGSQLVFKLEDVRDGKLIGYSQNFGKAEFIQSAFKRIDFNIYPKGK